MTRKPKNLDFVHWFRSSSPYIHTHRGCTFVVMFDGEAVADPGFPNLVHDIATLYSLGIRLVLVHGARPQIEARLRERQAKIVYRNGLRITDDEALVCVKDAAGSVRVEIEALLSMGVANTPMSGACIRVASGNFVTAKPLGVRDGIDHCHTGEIRRIDTEAIRKRLDDDNIVLISPLGYSPTGEIFNISAEETATAVAAALQADKLIFLMEGKGLLDSRRHLIQQLTPSQAEQLLSKRKLPETVAAHLRSAINACRSGVHRSHLLNRQHDGALLQELFTRDGIGTMITDHTYEELRPASIEDAGGILELIAPLEEEGILVRRSRERLEMEINHFAVVERDGMIIACAALYPYPQDALAELACLVVHPDYRKQGRGDMLMEHVENRSRDMGIKGLFVLTTHTAHWFQERGFDKARTESLPMQRQKLYNYQRNSKVFIKPL